MSIEIDGVSYVSAAELQSELGTTRQTLWRWRKEGKIPQGRRYRDRQVVFTEDEARVVRDYANRLVPAEVSGGRQLGLFNAGSSKGTL